MVPKPIVANSSFVTYKYGKNKLGVEVRKSKNAKKKKKHIYRFSTLIIFFSRVTLVPIFIAKD